MLNLLRCHAAAYHAIKERYPEAQIGVAKQLRIFEPRPDGNRLDNWWAEQYTSIFNHAWLKAMASGRLQQPFGRASIKGLAGSFDFIGINYYTRNYVRFPPRRGVIDEKWEAGRRKKSVAIMFNRENT